MEPICTGMNVTCPEAVFDLISMTLIGSMTPVAVTSTSMLRRITDAVWIATTLVSFFAQPATVATSRTSSSLRFTADSGSRRKVGKRNCLDGLWHVAADQSFDLCLGRARVEARLNQSGARIVE